MLGLLGPYVQVSAWGVKILDILFARIVEGRLLRLDLDGIVLAAAAA